MCFQKTTTVTQTGLGDDQYKALSGNQTNMASQVEEGFTGAGTKLDNISGEVSGIGGKIDTAAEGIKTNANTGFTDLTTLLSGYGDTLTQGQTTAASGREKYYNDMLAALENNTGGLQSSLDAGFTSAAGRFDDLDQTTSNIDTNVTQGFEDAQGDRNQMKTDIGTAFTDQNTALGTSFNTLGSELGTAFGETNTNISNAQTALQEGQQGLGSDLSTLSGNLDAYGTTMIGNQDTMLDNQQGYQTAFDEYVNRYGEDAELASQSRADIQTAQANATDRLREDIGSYAQATATGQSNLGKRLGDLGDATGAGFEVLSGAVEGGFSSASAADQVARDNLSTRIGNVKTLLETTGENLDAATTAQYSALADSFDANGELITNAIDAQGNTISRSMDDAGKIIETKFDGAGNEISKVQMDVETMLSNAETYQNSLAGQLSGLGDAIGTGFMDNENSLLQGIQAQGSDLQSIINTGFDAQAGTLSTQATDLLGVASTLDGFDAGMQGQFADIASAFDAQGNLIQNSTDNLGNTLLRQIDASGNLITQRLDSNGNVLDQSNSNINDALSAIQSNTGSLSDRISAGFQDVTSGQADIAAGQEGLMAESAASQGMIRDQSTAITQGFNAAEGILNTQTRDLARVASSQTEIDMRTRQDFKQLGDAFDDQGNLIANSVMNNGTTISRAVDQQGNLLLRAFDTQGRSLGDKVININRSLATLSELPVYAGANTSMGNLSPAMQAPTGGVQTSGFMSPYTMTR